MPELSEETRRRIESLRPLVPDLLAERGISEASKVCNFLAVALRLRPMALTYLPAEMPGGAKMGEAMDRYYLEHHEPPGGGLLSKLGLGRKAAANKQAELSAKRKTLDAAYNQVVAPSPAYVAHLNWLDRMALDPLQIKRRPTLREMYIYADREDRVRLLALEDAAAHSRGRPTTGADRDPNQAIIEYVYGAEFDRDYVLGLGKLLGYPDCCSVRYAEDRLRGQNVEQRAYEQISEAHESGKSIDVHAYFVKDFFPCTPGCPAAISRGEEFEAAFALLDGEVRDLYAGALYDSFELAQSYPLVIQQHRQRLEEATRRR